MKIAFYAAVLITLATAASAQVAVVGNGVSNGNAAGNANGNGNAGNLNGNLNGNLGGNLNGNSTVSTSASANALTLKQVRQAPSVYAPGLAAAGIESCLGSTSAGGSAAGFGLTIGGTYTDRGCSIRLYSRSLWAMGHRQAATQILCNDPDVAQALSAEGFSCLIGPGAAAAPSPAPAASYTGVCKHYDARRGCIDDGPAEQSVGATAIAAPAEPASCNKYDIFRGCLD